MPHPLVGVGQSQARVLIILETRTGALDGARLAVIEAMKVFNEIRAELAGTVEAICVASGDEVEAGQELIRFA